MNNESQQNSTSLVIPLKVVTGIIIVLVVVLLTYIFCNYAVATTLQQAPALSRSVYAPDEQNRWEMLDTHAHLIVYRDDDSVSLPSKAVLNIFVNDQYHTSLLPHARAVELILCPGIKKVNVALSQLDQHRFTHPSKVEEMSPTLQAGERYYFKAALDNQGKITARWMPENEATSAFAGFEPQMRTLSRVKNERSCPEVTYSFDSAGIFTHYNSSTLLSDEGNNALAALINTINSKFKEIDKIVVKNHSDINSNNIVVHPLSQMRANSVTTRLVKADLPSPFFISQGKDLFCSILSASKHDDQACLDLKRSLDVEVYGVRRSLRSLQ